MPGVNTVRRRSTYRIGVDTGGTFTDVVVADESGRLTVGKALTTRERIAKGLLNAVADAAAQLAVESKTLLGKTNLLVYGSTRATNAIIEHKTAKTALLVTAGVPDILVRREGGKANPWDFSQPYPEPYIPRRLTFELRERVAAGGEILTPLDEVHARTIIEKLEKLHVEAVAVCFLWSMTNPANEAAMGALLERLMPRVPYTLSHKLNPIIREYRRASSTAIDASLKPLMQEHLREMERDLRDAGFEGELLPATSLGGVAHINDVIEKPIHMVRSGPSLAPVLGGVYGRAETGTPDVIVCDTGGTSFDVSLVRGGRPVYTRETWLGGKYAGHLTGLSAVDTRSIGAGGGSIAWLDSGGLLRVGPKSAGADPGPACYSRGGTLATVTDAALVLGYLDPSYFLGGRMQLDVAAARSVVDELAANLGQRLEEMAYGILTVASEHMVEAIKEITINEGVDPRESLLVAGGGAAGLNMLQIARELGCERVLFPRTAGALSACGAQFSDIVRNFSVNGVTLSNNFAFDKVNGALDSISAAFDSFERELRHRGVKDFQRDYFVEARYPHQVWEIDVPLPVHRFSSEEDVVAVVDAFHNAHRAIFSVHEAGQKVEFIQWKGQITAQLDHPVLERLEPQETVRPAATRLVPGFFKQTGKIDLPVHRGDSLTPGMIIEGPALIHEPTTSIVVYPQSSATVTAYGNYMVRLT